MFNNAGVGIGGQVDELSLKHWNRALDVNVRGVIHGVHAAYPLMLAQGFGHIVNTGSADGLLPVPLLAPLSLRRSRIGHRDQQPGPPAVGHMATASGSSREALIADKKPWPWSVRAA
jgi:NAD(P)-dependent dehydrogenase (short-subunit alcohol dehydrogenase family)